MIVELHPNRPIDQWGRLVRVVLPVIQCERREEQHAKNAPNVRNGVADRCERRVPAGSARGSECRRVGRGTRERARDERNVHAERFAESECDQGAHHEHQDQQQNHVRRVPHCVEERWT